MGVKDEFDQIDREEAVRYIRAQLEDGYLNLDEKDTVELQLISDALDWYLFPGLGEDESDG